MSSFARGLVELGQSHGTRIEYGVAVSSSDVLIDGAATAVTLPTLAGFQTGDYLAILVAGVDRLVLGVVGGLRGRFYSGEDVDLASTDHALTTGDPSGLHIVQDGNEVQAKNDAAASQLNLNVEGGLVKAGSGGLGANWTAITSGAVAAANWTIDDFGAWVAGHLLQFRLIVSRTTTAIAQTASGNISNVTAGTLPASCRGNINSNLTCPANGQAGRVCGGNFNPSTGVVQLTALAGTSDLAIGEQVTFGGFFIITD